MRDHVLIKPRWAINGYCVGGLALVGVGTALVALPLVIAPVRREAGWLAVMGVGFIVLGVAWIAGWGRWGRLKESAKAAQDGVPGQAVIVAAHKTMAATGKQRVGTTTHRVVRLDLDVEVPGIEPYRVRVYRNLRVRFLPMATVGQTLNVRVLPKRLRAIALEWPEPDGPRVMYTREMVRTVVGIEKLASLFGRRLGITRHQPTDTGGSDRENT